MSETYTYEEKEISQAVENAKSTRAAAAKKRRERKEMERLNAGGTSGIDQNPKLQQEKEKPVKPTVSQKPIVVITLDDDEDDDDLTDFDEDANENADYHHKDADANADPNYDLDDPSYDPSKSVDFDSDSESHSSRSDHNDDSADSTDDDDEEEEDDASPNKSQTPLSHNTSSQSRNNNSSSSSKRNEPPFPEPELFAEERSKRPRLDPPVHSDSPFESAKQQTQCLNCVQYFKKIEELNLDIARKDFEIREKEQELKRVCYQPREPNTIAADMEKLKKDGVLYRKEIDEQKEEIQKQSATIQKLQKEKDVNKCAYESLQEELEKVKENNKVLESALKKAENDIECCVKEGQTRENEDKRLRAALDSLRETLGLTTEKVKDCSLPLSAELNDLIVEISGLKITFNELAKSNAELSDTIRKQKQELEDLKGKYQQQLAAVKILEGKREDWILAKKGFEAQVGSLRESLGKMNADRELIFKQKEELNSKAQECATKILELQTEIKRLKVENNLELKAQVDSTNERLAKIQAKQVLWQEQEEKYKTDASKSAKEIEQLQTEKQDLIRARESKEEYMLEVEIKRLSKSVKKLEWDFGRLNKQMGDYYNKTFNNHLQECALEHETLPLEQVGESLDKLSLYLEDLQRNWIEHKSTAFDKDGEATEKTVLGLLYDVEAFELAMDEVEKDFMWNQEKLEEKQRQFIVQAQAKAKKEHTQQEKRISQLNVELLQCAKRFEAVEASHKAEVAKLSETISMLKFNNSTDELCDKREGMEWQSNLVRLLTETGDRYKNEAEAGKTKIAKLESDRVLMESALKQMDQEKRRLKEDVIRRDARIADLETKLQQLRPYLVENVGEESKSEIILPAFAASAAGSSSSFEHTDTYIMDALEKGDSESFELVLPSTVELIKDKNVEEWGGGNEYPEQLAPTLGTTLSINDDSNNEHDKEGNQPKLQLVTCSADKLPTPTTTFSLPQTTFTFPQSNNTSTTFPSARIVAAEAAAPATISNSDWKSLSSSSTVVVEKPYTTTQLKQVASEQIKFLESKEKEPQERLTKCDACGKRCTSKSNLKQHINNIHLGTNNVRCKYCGKGFQNNSNLQKHVRKVHEKGVKRIIAKGRKRKGKKKDLTNGNTSE